MEPKTVGIIFCSMLVAHNISGHVVPALNSLTIPIAEKIFAIKDDVVSKHFTGNKGGETNSSSEQLRSDTRLCRSEKWPERRAKCAVKKSRSKDADQFSKFRTWVERMF